MGITTQPKQILGELPLDGIERLLANSGLGLWILYADDQGELMVEADETLLSLIGPEGGYFPGRLADFIEGCVHPDDREQVVQEAARSGWSDGLTFRLGRPEDGPWRWAQARGEILERGPAGEVKRAFGSLTDIDDLRRAEERLKNGEAGRKKDRQRLDAIIEAIGLTVWEWDLTTDTAKVGGGPITASKGLNGPARPVGEIWSELLSPDNQEKIVAAKELYCRGEAPSYEVEIQLRTPDGRSHWGHDRGQIVEWDEEGRPTLMMGATLDVTGLKAAAKAQANSLKVISERNETLARQLAERNKVMNDIQQQVEALVNNPGSRLDEVQMSIRQQMLNLKAAMAQDEEASDGGFSRYLKLAFQFIANERVWYKAVLDSLPFPTSVFDLSRRWTYLNPAAAETVGGAKLEDLINRHYVDGWKNYEDTDVRFQDGVTGKKTFTRRLPYSDRFFSGQSSFLLDDQRRPIGVIETMQDVTEAREADERIRLMLDTIPLACSLFSRDGSLIDCNQAAAGTCGLTDKRKYLQNFFDLMPMGLPDGRKTADALRCAIDQAFADGRADIKKFFLRSTKGINIPVEVHLIRLAWRDDYIVLGYFHDLRNIQEAKAELERERLILRDILG